MTKIDRNISHDTREAKYVIIVILCVLPFQRLFYVRSRLIRHDKMHQQPIAVIDSLSKRMRNAIAARQCLTQQMICTGIVHIAGGASHLQSQ